MDWGTVALLGALCLMAALFSWRTDTRPIGAVLLAQMIICTGMVVIVGDEAEHGINALGELAIILAAGPVILYRPIIASSILTLSTLSCCTTIAYWNSPITYSYEVTVNLILFIQCLIITMTDFWNVVGDSITRFYRWHSARRKVVRAWRQAGFGPTRRDP